MARKTVRLDQKYYDDYYADELTVVGLDGTHVFVEYDHFNTQFRAGHLHQFHRVNWATAVIDGRLVLRHDW